MNTKRLDASMPSGCECGGGVKYECWLINHQERIARYLNLRSDNLCREAAAIRIAGVMAGEEFKDHYDRLTKDVA